MPVGLTKRRPEGGLRKGDERGAAYPGSGRLRPLLAGPGAGKAIEASARGAIREASYGPEDRTLQSERAGELEPAHVPLVWLGCLLLVDRAPSQVEDLLGGKPGDEASGDAERNE